MSLFGREHGVFRGLAKGSRRERSRFSGGVDLLTLGDVVAIIKPSVELATVTEWALARVWWRIRRDSVANRAAYYLAECISRMLDQRDPHPGVFDGLVGTLDALEDGMSHEQALLRFQWLLLVDTGYKPKLELSEGGDLETVFFSAREGRLVSDDRLPNVWRVRRGTIKLLQSLEATGKVPVEDQESIRRAARLLAAYLRELLGMEPTTMRLVFPDLAGRCV